MFASYVQEAQRLKEKYSDKIHIVIGCESEMVREESSEDVRKLAARHKLSYIMGSVHHVDGVPIDYDDATLAKVENKYGSTEALFVRYFELVKQMVEEQQPTIVGHFDLIRLLRPEQDLTAPILAAADAAMDAAIAQGCLFEINTSGLRKGLQGPYPHLDLAKVALIEKRGGVWTVDRQTGGV